jgi:hypothetical protein
MTTALTFSLLLCLALLTADFFVFKKLGPWLEGCFVALICLILYFLS